MSLVPKFLQGNNPDEAYSQEDRFPGGIRQVRELPPAQFVPPSPKEVDIVKRGEAIASVRALEDRVEAQAQRIAALERELQTCHDRQDLLAEERTKWRRDAQMFQTQLTALAADMSNVHQLTERAAKTHAHVLSIIRAATPAEDYNQGGTVEEAIEESEAVRKLHEIATLTDPHMEALRKQITPDAAGDHGVPPQER